MEDPEVRRVGPHRPPRVSAQRHLRRLLGVSEEQMTAVLPSVNAAACDQVLIYLDAGRVTVEEVLAGALRNGVPPR